MFAEDILQLGTGHIALVHKQILDSARVFLEFRRPWKNMVRFSPCEWRIEKAVARVEPSRAECRPHVDEIHHRIARNRKETLAKTIDIRHAGHFLGDPVNKERGADENDPPEKTVGLEERLHINPISEVRVEHGKFKKHIAHHAVASGIDAMHCRRAAVAK